MLQNKNDVFIDLARKKRVTNKWSIRLYSVPSSRTSQTSNLFCACDASTFFAGDVRDDELLVITLTRLWAPIIFILSFVGERAPACRNLKPVSFFSATDNNAIKVVTFAHMQKKTLENMLP